MESSNRQNLIENLMNTSNREKEIEDEIATLKDNYKKFDKKIKFNNRIIMKIETEFTTKKKELKVLIHAKKTYLSELLKRGKDIR